MKEFSSTSTADEVLADISLKGKRIFVTGVSAGIGIETARTLVAHGAQVVGAARDLRKAREATREVRSAADTSGANFDLIELDLSSFASVRACAQSLLDDGRRFDVVIANAGVMATPFGHTLDGFETQFGVNHVGHYLLVNRILSLFAENGRLVTLSSAGHRLADVDLEDPNFENTAYDPWVAYGRSKTANILFAVEFDRLFRSRGLRACSVMPGIVNTQLGRHMTAAEVEAFVTNMNTSRKAVGMRPAEFKSLGQGAATSIWAAMVADSDQIGGLYCEDCGVAPLNNGSPFESGVRSYALDVERAQKLWLRTEQLVNAVQ